MPDVEIENLQVDQNTVTNFVFKNSDEEPKKLSLKLDENTKIGDLKSLLVRKLTDFNPFFLEFNMYNWETLGDLKLKLEMQTHKQNKEEIILFGGE
jgi:hypothetical protein